MLNKITLKKLDTLDLLVVTKLKKRVFSMSVILIFLIAIIVLSERQRTIPGKKLRNM